MLTKEEVLEAIKDGKESQCWTDSRDYMRLIIYFDTSEWYHFGFEINDGKSHTPKDWTIDNILNQLKDDLEFAFEKALNKRGISSSEMFEVIKMWMWVLEDELQNFKDDEYAMYGLPLYKAVALKYGFENQIGNDSGSEEKYND